MVKEGVNLVIFFSMLILKTILLRSTDVLIQNTDWLSSSLLDKLHYPCWILELQGASMSSIVVMIHDDSSIQSTAGFHLIIEMNTTN